MVPTVFNLLAHCTESPDFTYLLRMDAIKEIRASMQDHRHRPSVDSTGISAIAKIQKSPPAASRSPSASASPPRVRPEVGDYSSHIPTESGQPRLMSSAERRARADGDHHRVGDAPLQGTSNLWRVTLGANSNGLAYRNSPKFEDRRLDAAGKPVGLQDGELAFATRTLQGGQGVTYIQCSNGAYLPVTDLAGSTLLQQGLAPWPPIRH